MPASLTHLTLILAAGLLFHCMLWARNARFLWSQRGLILRVIIIGQIWNIITEPIGAAWGAWYFDPDKVLGIWILPGVPIEDVLGNVVIVSAAACAVLVFGYSERRWI